MQQESVLPEVLISGGTSHGEMLMRSGVAKWWTSTIGYGIHRIIFS